MANLTRAETAALFGRLDRFAILTHRRPDGDTLGSAALLCRGLRQLGKHAHIVENPEITAKYAFLHAGLTKPCAEKGDTVVCVDTASRDMLCDCFRPLTVDVRIDHHATAEDFTANALVDPDAAACGEIVYDVLCLMGAQLDTQMANALYTAISTDTGCFRFSNTTANTFTVAAACARVSSDLFDLNQILFMTNTLARLRVQSYLTQNAQFLCGGKIVLCALPLETERALGATQDDMDNIAGFPRSFEGVQMAALLRQEADGRVKLSVRAIPGLDASAVCAKFGGGGHKGAAGASMRLTMDEAVKAVIEALPEI